MVLLTNNALVQKEEARRLNSIASKLLSIEKKVASKAKPAANKANKQARTSSRPAPLSRSSNYRGDSEEEYQENEE
jgi:hypothetical protein